MGKSGEEAGKVLLCFLSRMYDEQDRTAFARPRRILADQDTAGRRKKLSFYWIRNSMQLF